MTLREKQSEFLIHVAHLIFYAKSIKIDVTFGEAWRSDEQQEIYIKQGKSKAKRSRHQDRLAVDLNVFIDGKYRTDREAYEPLAKFWKALHPDNVAGYDWGWDANHFERRP
jgi:hypothetical protein